MGFKSPDILPDLESGVREELFPRRITISSPGGFGAIAKALEAGEISAAEADELADGVAQLVEESAAHACEFEMPDVDPDVLDAATN